MHIHECVCTNLDLYVIAYDSLTLNAIWYDQYVKFSKVRQKQMNREFWLIKLGVELKQKNNHNCLFIFYIAKLLGHEYISH